MGLGLHYPCASRSHMLGENFGHLHSLLQMKQITFNAGLTMLGSRENDVLSNCQWHPFSKEEVQL